MKKEKVAKQPVPVQIIFNSRAWVVFAGNKILTYAMSGQQLVDWANMYGWSIQNRDNLVPSLRNQLAY